MKPERGERERDGELIAAYVDGVAELSPDERRRVEARLARDPEVRADATAVRDVLDRLRALPPPGNEPDWAAMERSIRDAVGPDVPRAWWRRWQWLVPMSTCMTAAAVLLVLWSRPPPERVVHTYRAPQPTVERTDRPERPDRGERHDRGADDVVPLWLDGSEVDVDLTASDLLGGALTDPTGPTDPSDPSDMIDNDAQLVDEPGSDLDALLPSSDLAWVDRLDDAAIDRAEKWLSSVEPVRRSVER